MSGYKSSLPLDSIDSVEGAQQVYLQRRMFSPYGFSYNSY